MHPLFGNIESLSDNEIDLKIQELSRKYFQTHNPGVQSQIASILDMLKEEARSRRARQILQQKEENGENSLDSLIKVS